MADVVTVDNFVRAETDRYFAMFVNRGALGRFIHRRELPVENTGVRPNRDTLYSEAVFDLDAGPVKITMPDSGDRFMSFFAIDEDHYIVDVAYGAGEHSHQGRHRDALPVRCGPNPGRSGRC